MMIRKRGRRREKAIHRVLGSASQPRGFGSNIIHFPSKALPERFHVSYIA